MEILAGESRRRMAERVFHKISGDRIDETVEYRARKKDGSYIDVTLNIAFSKDKPDKALMIAHDVTERKRAEAALREREAKYRTCS